MNKKKLIAPIVITVILVALLISYFITTLVTPIPFGAKIFGLALCLFLIGVSVFVLIERIQEIRKGEEDDLSQY
jgi:hypothetical protein